MATNPSSTSILDRAEWLLALGCCEEVDHLLKQIPRAESRTLRFRELHLRLMTATGQWREGILRAENVLRESGSRLRQAAGRFFAAYSMSEETEGNNSHATDLLMRARSIWPEGKVDPLILGVAFRTDPAGAMVEPIQQLTRLEGKPAERVKRNGKFWDRPMRTPLLRLSLRPSGNPCAPAPAPAQRYLLPQINLRSMFARIYNLSASFSAVIRSRMESSWLFSMVGNVIQSMPKKRDAGANSLGAYSFSGIKTRHPF